MGASNTLIRRKETAVPVVFVCRTFFAALCAVLCGLYAVAACAQEAAVSPLQSKQEDGPPSQQAATQPVAPTAGALLKLAEQHSTPYAAKEKSLPASATAAAAHVPPKKEAKGKKEAEKGGGLASETTMTRADVKIGGMKIVTKVERGMKKQEAAIKGLPAAFKGEAARKAMQERSKIEVFKHNPVEGTLTAPIVVVELVNMECEPCREMLKKVDEARKPFGDKVALVHVSAPVDVYSRTGVASFYGQVAAKLGKFKEYRAALLERKELKSEDYLTVLLEQKVTPQAVRRITQKSTAALYRELDADAELNRSLAETSGIAVYVNGLKIGGGIPFDALGDLIRLELKNKGIAVEEPAKKEKDIAESAAADASAKGEKK